MRADDQPSDPAAGGEPSSGGPQEQQDQTTTPAGAASDFAQEKLPGLLTRLLPSKSKDNLQGTTPGGIPRPASATKTSRADRKDSRPPAGDAEIVPPTGKNARFTETAQAIEPTGEATEEAIPATGGELEVPGLPDVERRAGAQGNLKKGRPAVIEGDMGTPSGGSVPAEVPASARRPGGKQQDIPGGGRPVDQATTAPSADEQARAQQDNEAYVPQDAALDAASKTGKVSAGKPGGPTQESKGGRKQPPAPEPIFLPTPGGEENLADEDVWKDKGKNTGAPGKSKKKGPPAPGTVLTPEEQALEDTISLARK